MSEASAALRGGTGQRVRRQLKRPLRAIVNARTSIPKQVPSNSSSPFMRPQVRRCYAEPDASGKAFEPIDLKPDEKLVFLAGGVCDDADWRRTLQAALSNASALPALALITPVGSASPGMVDPRAQLLRWQISHFSRSHLIIFWFHRFTGCPGTLLEFGQWAVPMAKKAKGRYKVVVGADPQYEKRQHLVVHCEGKYKLHDSLESLAAAAADVLRAM